MDVSARRWISSFETAALYGLHVKSVLILCRLGRIPHTRIPSIRGGRGQIRIDRVAFDRQLEESEVLAVEKPLDRRRRRS